MSDEITFHVHSQTELITRLEDMLARARAGTLRKCCFRVYRGDAWKDVAFGETDEERAVAMAELHQMFRSAN